MPSICSLLLGMSFLSGEYYSARTNCGNSPTCKGPRNVSRRRPCPRPRIRPAEAEGRNPCTPFQTVIPNTTTPKTCSTADSLIQQFDVNSTPTVFVNGRRTAAHGGRRRASAGAVHQLRTRPTKSSETRGQEVGRRGRRPEKAARRGLEGRIFSPIS